MRFRPRTDRNQASIVEALRKCGIGVIILAGLGKGVPDLLVSSKTKMRLLEVKIPGERESLTPDQRKFFSNWVGVPIEIVTTPMEALEIML